MDKSSIQLRRNAMKKLMTLMLGLALVVGTVTAFGADKATGKKSTAKKSTVKAKKTVAK